MLEIKDLYHQLIIDHGRKPRNFFKLANATHSKEGFNPLCGDRLNLYLKENEGIIEELSFEGAGCAISMASASLMTEILKNKKIPEAQEVFRQFHRLVTGEEINIDSSELGKLIVLGGVSEFPARVKCATLSWHTMMSLLEGDHGVVSTE